MPNEPGIRKRYHCETGDGSPRTVVPKILYYPPDPEPVRHRRS